MHHACYVRTLLALALIVALALAASACTGEDDGSSVPVRVPTASATPERTPVAATPTSSPTSSPAPTPVAASPTGPIEASLTVGFAEVFGGREFDRPVELGAYPAGPQPGQTMFVAEQSGRILLLRAGSDEAGLLLDLRNEVLTRGNEQGLLSVALDPRFEENGYLWLYYSAAGTPAVSRLSRFAVDPDDPLRVDPDSELVILDVEQPYSNHNGGAIRFGPDGMLYLGYGDGGSAGDPKRNGQNLGTLLGSVIRIDVRFASEAGPYSIPAGNPFIQAEGARPEIWAYGLRNPWRMAFDPATGVLWAGDVGQNEVEEIDRIERGANYALESPRGQPLLRAPRGLRPRGHAAPGCRVWPRPGLLGDGWRRVPRRGDHGARRPLPVRRLLQRPAVGAPARGRCGRRAPDDPASGLLVRHGCKRRGVRADVRWGGAADRAPLMWIQCPH